MRLTSLGWPRLLPKCVWRGLRRVRSLQNKFSEADSPQTALHEPRQTKKARKRSPRNLAKRIVSARPARTKRERHVGVYRRTEYACSQSAAPLLSHPPQSTVPCGWGTNRHHPYRRRAKDVCTGGILGRRLKPDSVMRLLQSARLAFLVLIPLASITNIVPTSPTPRKAFSL
jgi:hypothetical protein